MPSLPNLSSYEPFGVDEKKKSDKTYSRKWFWALFIIFLILLIIVGLVSSFISARIPIKDNVFKLNKGMGLLFNERIIVYVKIFNLSSN